MSSEFYPGDRNNSSSDASGGGGADTTATLYATCSHLPLIKSPALRVPPAVTLPPSLHPLPPNIHDYFVYPFSLEAFVLDAANRREREKREEMQRRAPGWTEGGGVLEPTKRAGGEGVDNTFKESGSSGGGGGNSSNSNDIDELGAMLDQLGQR